jgi:hypothetical protein
MLSSVKYGLYIIALAGISWIGFTVYGYFFSLSGPQLYITGIEPDGCYAGEAYCTVRGNDEYKVALLSLLLDGKPLVQNFKINKKAFTYEFTLPTTTLSQGKHVLEVTAQNGTYYKTPTRQEVTFTVDNIPLQAAFVKGNTDAQVFQGRTLHVQLQANKELAHAQAKTLSKNYPCFTESHDSLIYECFIPIECDQTPNEYPLTIELRDRVGNSYTLESKFQVVAFPFKKQSLRFDAEKVKAETDAGLSEKQFDADMQEINARSEQLKEPRQITTEFGVIRTTQERGLRQHKALDIYNTPRSVVWAPQDGVIVLKNRYAHSGNTVVIDHGYNVLTLLFHLDSFAPIELGDKIRRGSPVGYIGKTGLATGYHLHWEMWINGVAVDPLQWTKQDF